MKKLFLIASILGFLAVLFGAFGAHGLKKIISSENMIVFETANRYHFYHLFAIYLVGILSKQFKEESFSKIGYYFTFGILLFSGSLYILAITNIKFFAYITPMGGLILLFSWGNLFYKIYKSK